MIATSSALVLFGYHETVPHPSIEEIQQVIAKWQDDVIRHLLVISYLLHEGDGTGRRGFAA